MKNKSKKRFCCQNCFNDRFLKEHIGAISNKTGTCSYCQAKNAILIDSPSLADRFEPLLDLYETDKKGESINIILQEDWNIFSISKSKVQCQLLSDITGEQNLLTQKYKSIFLKEKKNVEQWEKFREELKHNNRFFPIESVKKEQIEPFGKHIGTKIKKGRQKFYRARVNNSDKEYELIEMGKPDKKLVQNGRANPIGISYLYVASTLDTAISEVRGHKEECVTVAEFEMKDDLELADLRDPKKTISPFELNDENELELIYKNMPFLVLLGNELSKPVIPRDANLEYLPSQYLSEIIKQIGFHGIIYKSSITDGNNYVIFDDGKLEATKKSVYKIKDVITTAQKIS